MENTWSKKVHFDDYHFCAHCKGWIVSKKWTFGKLPSQAEQIIPPLFVILAFKTLFMSRNLNAHSKTDGVAMNKKCTVFFF